MHTCPPPLAGEGSACGKRTHPKPNTGDHPLSLQRDIDHAAELLTRIAANLTTRGTDGLGVLDRIRDAIAGHRKRLDLDPDYLDRRTAPPQPQPSPLDDTAAAAAALRARHMTELEADRGDHRPPPDIAHAAITDARNALHTERRQSGNLTTTSSQP